MRQPALEPLSQLAQVVVPESGVDAHRGAHIGRQGWRYLRDLGGQSIVGTLRQTAFAGQADQAVGIVSAELNGEPAPAVPVLLKRAIQVLGRTR